MPVITNIDIFNMASGLITTAYNDQSFNPQQGRTDLVVLREQLQNLGVWPEAGDKFLELLPVSRWDSAPITDADTSWLPVVIDGVISGLDIGARFPSFFQKLLMNDVLRKAFLVALSDRLKP